jgi:hypothetical protein
MSGCAFVLVVAVVSGDNHNEWRCMSVVAVG